MKTLFLFIAVIYSSTCFSQKIFFRVYNDSVSLVQDANHIVQNFTKDINAIKPIFSTNPEAVLNTQPSLIFYSSEQNRINLPIWEQVMSEQKEFFFELGGGQENGKEIFGLFFNGFFLPHELGHALQEAANSKENNLYQNEYFANIVAILYWRNENRNEELQHCYTYAKKMMAQLPNPVPDGEDPIEYFNNNYDQLGANPYKYGYYQFAQIVEIFEDKTLPNFEEYIRNYLSK